MLNAFGAVLPVLSGVHIPSRSRLSDSDRDLLLSASLDFVRTFRHGFAFSSVCELAFLILNQPITSTDLRRSLLSSLRFSRDLAAYPFIDSVAQILIKPDLSTLTRWLSFTAATSLATAASLRTIDVLSANSKSDTLSLGRWPEELAERVGFQVAARAAGRYLPPPEQLGGLLGRDVAVVTAGALAAIGTTAHIRIARGGWRQLLGDCVGTLPAVFFETAVFRAVGRIAGIAE
jgi:hypothetical protein